MGKGDTTLVTQRLLDAKGKWGDFGDPSYPITETDIRRWAIAVYWPEQPPRIYWDPEYAKTTRWGGIIAPPGLNPFAWPIPDPKSDSAFGGGMSPTLPIEGEPGQFMLNGGMTRTFLKPMRPGDVIRSRGRLKDWSEREGRLGLMIFINSEGEQVNQNDEVVGRTISTLIRY